MRLAGLLTWLLVGCGGPPPAAVEVDPDPEPAPAPSDATGDAAPLWPRLSDAAAGCPPLDSDGPDALARWADGCEVRSTAGFDAASGEWVVLDVDRSEAGVERVRLSRASVGATTAILDRDGDPAGIAALRARLADVTASPPTDLVRARTEAEFSLNDYAPRVSLGAPLAGHELWIETVDDLDRPEHVLWLISEGGARRALARRTAPTGPCDGGGFHCSSTQAQCDADGLRAEGRLCVLPLGVVRVAVGPHGTLIVQGTVQVGGHGGAPAFHWVAAWEPGD